MNSRWNEVCLRLSQTEFRLRMNGYGCRFLIKYFFSFRLFPWDCYNNKWTLWPLNGLNEPKSDNLSLKLQWQVPTIICCWFTTPITETRIWPPPRNFRVANCWESISPANPLESHSRVRNPIQKDFQKC